METTMRRRSILKFKRYIIIFFVVLLAIIWINHYSQGKTSKKELVEDIPVVEQKTYEEEKPSPRTESAREKSLRIFYERLMRPDQDEDTTTEETELEDSYKYSWSLNDIQRRKLRRAPASRFFVKNPKCKMPYADPFSSEALAIPKPEKLNNCSHEGPIFALKFDRKLVRYRLQVNRTMLAKLQPNLRKYRCAYREVPNDTITPWTSFQDEALIDWIPSGIVAKCHDALKATRTIQQDAFPLVQVPYRRARVKSDPLKRKPSVLMLGLDSISRMNFKRSMPKAAEFVKQEGWFEMEGYNKIEDSAYATFCAIFGGAKSDKTCEKRFPMIWNSYKEAGYTTAFGEDSLESHVPPFRPDFQLRTLLEDIGQSMDTASRFGFQNCIGRRQSISYLYDFCMQFAQRLIEELDQPAFGVFWSSTLTRDYLNGPASLDEKLVEYLRLMRDHHIFERAIVILFSDQGQTSGDLVDLADGFLEERLPMLHIYLPPWFRKAYPMFASNLLLNSNRLTTPFDLYNTLRHILNLKASVPKELKSTMNCRLSQSLLHLMPFNRSCEQACIGLHWCGCNEFALVENNFDAYYLAKTFVSFLNYWILKNNYNKYCHRLLLSHLDYVERSLDDLESLESGIFRLRVRTVPHKSVFESTVHFNSNSRTLIKVNIRDISRLNSNNRSDCVKDRTAKKFCICYPEIKDEEMEFWINYTL
ncbi:uncharacterized protein [Drosophila kikkawai]|uniref:Uncharacterized protein n=1 Tax=Drosophila kikkawai TaxID=30033 RepID=A0A6P4IXA6_DROKI|nr:uncharacterized protein LOC108082688 [Drosophila kikkawai]